MIPLKLSIQDRDDSPECLEIKEQIKSFNTSKVGDAKKRGLSIFYRDDAGKLRAGIVGNTLWGWLSVDLLWVDDSLRGQRIGERLMNEAEKEALNRGCSMALVDTFSFQAPGFYKKLGYQNFAQLQDFPTKDCNRHYFCKKLSNVKVVPSLKEPLQSNLSSISLAGELVDLRELSEYDFEVLHSFASDPEFLKYQAWGPNTLEQTRGYFDAVSNERQSNPRLDFNLAIASKESGQFLGNTSLALSRTEPGNAEIGYNVLNSFSGKGLATDAAKTIIAFAFKVLKLKRVEAFCHPDNIASIKIMTKLNMTNHGLLKNHRMVRGVERDSIKFTISPACW